MKNYKISALILAAIASAGVSYAAHSGLRTFRRTQFHKIPELYRTLMIAIEHLRHLHKESPHRLNVLSIYIHIIIGREALSPTKKATTQLII